MSPETVPMTKQQQKVLFGGVVQGVGFRFTASRLAGEYDISGYVKNLPDGRVECVVEGEPDDIQAFVDALSVTMSDYIKTRAQQEVPYSGKFTGFGVSY